MNRRTRYSVPLTAMAAVVLAAFGPSSARAQEPAGTGLRLDPPSEVSAGAGYVFEDNQRFGQFNGLTQKGFHGLLDFNLIKRFDETGWFRFFGRNVGFDNRELRLGVERQGNWRFSVDFSQVPNFIPFTVTTGLVGIGTANQTINGTTPVSYDLDTKRKIWTLGFGKELPAGWDLQVSYQNQKKEGSRFWGQGDFGGGYNFLTDPIDYTTDLLEATVGYADERLQLRGGYYGTWFSNANPAVNVFNGIAALTPMTLPPDNRSWQAFLSGGYNFTPTTRANFKVSYEQQTQDTGFVVTSPTGRANLGGDVDTTLAQIGLASRPIPKLTLNADLRYLDRNDRTPIAQYIQPLTVVAPGQTWDGTNEPRSLLQWFGKVEASYQLPMAFRAIGAIDYLSTERNAYAVRSVSFRSKVEETSYRAEVRRSFADQFTGSLAYIYSQRDGSSFLTNELFFNSPTVGFTTGSNNIAPLHLSDRDRNRARFTLNWAPIEPLAFTFFADVANDSYENRGTGMGLLDGKFQNYSIDASYAFTPDWQLTAWYSYNTTTANQVSCNSANTTGGGCPTTAALWQAKLANTSNAVGLGLRGKPATRIEIGADLQYQNLVDKYDQFLVAPTTSTVVVGPLPDIKTRLTTVKLWGTYGLDKHSGIRVDYIYDRFDTNDWTWTTWVYTDGTTVSQEPLQTVNFLGISYYYRFH